MQHGNIDVKTCTNFNTKKIYFNPAHIKIAFDEFRVYRVTFISQDGRTIQLGNIPKSIYNPFK